VYKNSPHIKLAQICPCIKLANICPHIKIAQICVCKKLAQICSRMKVAQIYSCIKNCTNLSVYKSTRIQQHASVLCRIITFYYRLSTCFSRRRWPALIFIVRCKIAGYSSVLSSCRCLIDRLPSNMGKHIALYNVSVL